jgi:tRNA dimethylallyltransferase
MDPIPILTGPTAVGKTSLSLALGQRLHAEIISADSRQVYRELHIGTAKPDREALRSVPHHFVDDRSLEEPFSAGMFRSEAYRRIAAIAAGGRTPLIVGGSTLYLRALKHGLADIPPVPAQIRAQLRTRLEKVGPHELFEELQSIDPAAAATMDATKTQRVLRALEVHAATGRTLTSYHDEQEPPPYSFRTVVLFRGRKELYARIERRVDEMLARGLIEEVRGLLAAGYDPSANPLRTIGYQEPIAHLRGEISHPEMVRLIKRNSRRYAKRQLTWFRREADNIWINAAQEFNALQAAVMDAVM